MDVRRRVLRALMIVPLLLACVAGVARAEVYYNDTGTEYQGLIAGYEYGEAGRHRATMEYLGFDWDSIGSVQQARLRTNSGGKNPYMAVYDSCQNIQYDWNGGVFDWPIFNVWSGIFGLSNMWYVGGVSAEDYQIAHDYVLQVITGTGGGESGGGGSGGVSIPASVVLTNGKGRYWDTNMNLAWAKDQNVTINITSENQQQLAELAEQYPYIAVIATISSQQNFGSAIPIDGEFLLSETPITIATTEPSYTGTYDKVTTTISSQTGIMQISYYAGSRNFPECTIGNRYGTNISNSGTITYRNFAIWTSENIAGPSEPVTPPQPEPDPPTTTPNPPETPTYVFDPVIGLTLPDITIESDPATNEIIDWLKLIHRDLSRISQEMNDYIEDASNAIVAAINNQGAALRRWFDTLSTQINDVYTYLVTMQERYLNELDRDITMWLRRIYSRLGGNGAAEPDPNEDEKGFWDWILEQLQKFFVGNVDEAADGLKGLLQQLTEFFPFSLPWDLMALFGLFAAEPVTPVFDVQLPVPAVIAADYGEPLHIDLHQWDGIMIVVRGLEKIFFAAWLISMVPTWLNDIKVGDM